MRAATAGAATTTASSGQSARASGTAERAGGNGGADTAASAPFSSALAAAQAQESSGGGTGANASGAGDTGEQSDGSAADGSQGTARQPAMLDSLDGSRAREGGRSGVHRVASGASTPTRTAAQTLADTKAALGVSAMLAASGGTTPSGTASDASTADPDANPAPASSLDGGSTTARASERAGRRGSSASATSDSSAATLALLLSSGASAAAAALGAGGNSALASAPTANASGTAVDAAAPGPPASLGAGGGQQTLGLQDARMTLSLMSSGGGADALGALASDGGGPGRDDGTRGGNNAAGDATLSTTGTAGTVVGPSVDGTAAPGLFDLLQGLSPGAAAVPGAAALSLPVSDPQWPNALATQVQWLATRQIQSATLRLTPEHLGPLEVRIEVAHSQINVNFSAHHPETREALAQAVPRLRELFSAGGLSLGQATVQQQQQSPQYTAPAIDRGQEQADKTVEPVANTVISRLGLIDEYV